MTKKVLLSVFAGIIILGGGLFILLKNKGEEPTIGQGIILFYGTGCPHCAKVEEYLQANNIESKINIEKKEVYNNKDNANLLAKIAKKCGIKENELGVPFLWTGSECKIGDEDIINFFKEKVQK